MQVGQRCGLPLLSPVDDAGKFTAEAGPRFEGEPRSLRAWSLRPVQTSFSRQDEHHQK